MKTLKQSLMALLILGAMACNKNTSPNSAGASTDDAADLVSASLAVNGDGALNGVTDITISAQAKINVDSLCGTTWADSVNRKINAGGFSYTYDAKYSYAVNCSTNLFGGSITASTIYAGTFASPGLTSTVMGTSDFTLGGLGAGSSTYNLNGEYKRSGSFQSKSDTSFAGTHNVDLVISNLVFTKPGRVIKSGTATVTIVGNTPKKGSFDFTGTIVFNGGNQATLTLNGNVYLVDLTTGAKVRR